MLRTHGGSGRQPLGVWYSYLVVPPKPETSNTASVLCLPGSGTLVGEGLLYADHRPLNQVTSYNHIWIVLASLCESLMWQQLYRGICKCCNIKSSLVVLCA